MVQSTFESHRGPVSREVDCMVSCTLATLATVLSSDIGLMELHAGDPQGGLLAPRPLQQCHLGPWIDYYGQSMMGPTVRSDSVGFRSLYDRIRRSLAPA